MSAEALVSVRRRPGDRLKLRSSDNLHSCGRSCHQIKQATALANSNRYPPNYKKILSRTAARLFQRLHMLIRHATMTGRVGNLRRLHENNAISVHVDNACSDSNEASAVQWQPTADPHASRCVFSNKGKLRPSPGLTIPAHPHCGMHEGLYTSYRGWHCMHTKGSTVNA